MDLNEYRSKMQQINTKFYNAKEELNLECVMSNKSANVGDVVTDGRGNILVQSIDWTNYDDRLPVALYKGPLLTSKLIPYKSGESGVAIEGKGFSIVKKDQK